MARGKAWWIAWSVWAAGLATGICITLLNLSNSSYVRPQSNGDDPRIDTFLILAVVTMLTVGALIGSRHPENPIGWILLAMAAGMTVSGFAEAYAIHAVLVAPGSLPFGTFMAWVDTVGQGVIFIGLWSFVFLLFPNGHLPSPRWRIVAWLSAAGFIGLLAPAIEPGPLQNFSAVNNPFGLAGMAGILETIGNLAFWLWLITLIASALSLVLRFRRARGEERQQLKWIAGAAGFMAIGFMLAPVIWFTPALSDTILWPVLFVSVLVAMPIAIAIAILRYHLYDIDILIRRTVTYSIVAVLLAVVYFGSVLLLQQLFTRLSGQHSEIVTVLSTLAIAALFIPVRNRVQNVIDRRFNRKKYDAQQVLADFGNTVRDETDLDKLTGRLIEVVNETMQPKTVSLWLRRETRSPK